MNTSQNRLLAPALVLTVLIGVVVGIMSAGRGTPLRAVAVENYAAETSALTHAQHQAYLFFQNGRVDAGSGQGLFETDFFKAKPVPVKPAKPVKPVPVKPAPTTREAVLFYRGLATFSDGARIAYVMLDDRALVLSLDEEVTDGWRLESFDGDQAVLAKDEARVTLPFNRRAIVSVAIKP